MSLVNCAEYPEVGVFKELRVGDTNVRQAVDVWSKQNPSVPAILSATLLMKHWLAVSITREWLWEGNGLQSVVVGFKVSVSVAPPRRRLTGP